MTKTNRTGVEERLSSSPTATAADWPELTHRELVSRVVASSVFARSERLSTLLTYICETSLKGRNGELNEQRIGHAVFGRARDYDSSVDGIVRTQASRLRHRLDLYFSQEGANEPVRIVIPRGGYVPIFTPQTRAQEAVQTAELAPLSPQVVAADVLTERRGMGTLLPWLLCSLLVVALAGLVARDTLHGRSIAPVSAAMRHPLWSQLLIPQEQTLIVPADSGLVLSHAFNPASISLLQYLAGDYRRSGSTPGSATEMQSLRANFANRRYTSVVDLEVAVWLAERAQSAQSSLQVRYARDLRPNDLKIGNVVILGAFEANPWMELFERNMNFVLQNDYKTGAFSVINKAPHAGEPAAWQSKGDDPQRRVYGVVAFTPKLSGSGNALLVEGTSMAGTEAAWDFVSDDAELLPFLKRIQRPDGSVPHFELLLGTQNVSSSAVHGNLLAWRVTN